MCVYGYYFWNYYVKLCWVNGLHSVRGLLVIYDDSKKQSQWQNMMSKCNMSYY